MFRLIYRESPQQFEKLLTTILPESGQLRVGPVFSQQEKWNKSVPDLMICQEEFNLFFETKTEDWFYDEQLSSHLEGLAKMHGRKVLFCLSNFESDEPESKFSKLLKEAKKHGVVVQFLSFESLLAGIRSLHLSAGLMETVDEFDDYLNRSDFLPQWRYLLDVVNCGDTFDEINAGAYMCPNLGGSYSHARAKYLGTYQNKTVPSVHEIEALFSCSPGGKTFEMKWNNTTESHKKLESQAREMIKKINPLHKRCLQETGLHIFLLGKGVETDFRKNSKGGLLGSKNYFWDIAKKLNVSNVEDLAEKLKGRKWSEFLESK